MGRLATSPLPCRVSKKVHRGGQNNKWPTTGELVASPLPSRGVPNASQQGTKSDLAHKWAGWLHDPRRIRGPQRFKGVDRIRSGPHVGGWATSPLQLGASPTLQRWGQSHQWPTCGRIGYLTPAVMGFPNASKRGTKSEVAHIGEDWLHRPYRLEGPQRFRGGDKIRSGP